MDAMTGQIVLVRLRNFMSYDDIELRPGPHLNLIIGPNGTGKSTFVCAVVLGLGGKLKILGRADQLSAYIQNGCDECVIDIELYDSNDENVQITRKIYSNNHSDFWINGTSVQVSKVNDLRKKYNIQLDNLCTFLPQEKVQDFSTLNPQQLLIQTQKTVGSEEMLAAYEQLKSLQKNLSSKEQENVDLEEKIEIEKQKNDRIKDKVQNYFEKRTLNQKLMLINQKKSWLCYHNELLKLKEITKDYKLAEEQYAKKKKAFAEVLQELERLEGEVKKAEESVSKSKRECADKESIIEDAIRKVREQIGLLVDFDVRLQSKLAEEESKKEELKQYQENFDKLNNDLSTFESMNGTDEQLQAKENEIMKLLTDYHAEELRFTEKKAAFENELEQIRTQLKTVSAEYRLLERKRDFRLEYIKRYEPDVYKSVEWLRENRHLFQGHIFNPMLLEIDVTDPKMAKYVEARIGYRDLISFTCTNPDDLNLLIKKLRIEQKLKVNAICSDDDDTTQYYPEVPINQIRPLGFFSYMKDLITGPEHIMRFLCKVYRIHGIPVGGEMVKSKCEKVPLSIPIFFSENHMFTVKASVYSGDKSINVKQLNEPKLFSMSLEKKKMEELQEKQKELEAAAEGLEKKIKLGNEEFKSSVEKINSIRQKKKGIATLKEEKKHILLKLQRAGQHVRSVQDSMRDPAEIRQEAEEEKKGVKEEIHRNFESLAEACNKLENCSYAMQECEIRYKVCRLNVNKLEQLKMNSSDDLRKLEGTVNVVKSGKEKMRANCEFLKEAAKKLTNNISPGERGFEKYEKEFQKLKNTVEELETELEETQVLADFLHGGNIEIVQEYEKREEAIAKMVTLLEERKNELKNTKSQVNTLKDKWLGPIKELVSTVNDNFGAFFKSMGCVGEVSLLSGANQDDFEQYGIAIKVKFRDEIPLQSLGRHFQSGGERAVTTAVYLLSLQKLMCVPFRFVDEINQGMDSTNERRIMNLMMNVTADDNSSQYFFITPKLLPNITCSEKIVIHCIYSGQKAIPSKNWNLQKFLSSA